MSAASPSSTAAQAATANHVPAPTPVTSPHRFARSLAFSTPCLYHSKFTSSVLTRSKVIAALGQSAQSGEWGGSRQCLPPARGQRGRQHRRNAACLRELL